MRDPLQNFVKFSYFFAEILNFKKIIEFLSIQWLLSQTVCIVITTIKWVFWLDMESQICWGGLFSVPRGAAGLIGGGDKVRVAYMASTTGLLILSLSSTFFLFFFCPGMELAPQESAWEFWWGPGNVNCNFQNVINFVFSGPTSRHRPPPPPWQWELLGIVTKIVLSFLENSESYFSAKEMKSLIFWGHRGFENHV